MIILLRRPPWREAFAFRGGIPRLSVGVHGPIPIAITPALPHLGKRGVIRLGASPTLHVIQT